jgi:hypothetical protein
MPMVGGNKPIVISVTPFDGRVVFGRHEGRQTSLRLYY